ncbi:MAG: flagellar export protein FliJ [Desulfitobacteriia bacterium]|jgi:flagellar FliJ protein
MGFKFRLENVLKLSEQELKIEQVIFSKELRTLQVLEEQKNVLVYSWHRALEGQKKAGLSAPVILQNWQRYAREQKENLQKKEVEIQEQEKIVAECKEKLLDCKIKVEKYRKLRAKKFQVYREEELRKDQAVLDEIAQNIRKIRIKA